MFIVQANFDRDYEGTWNVVVSQLMFEVVTYGLHAFHRIHYSFWKYSRLALSPCRWGAILGPALPTSCRE
jgi:hypothetical protein